MPFDLNESFILAAERVLGATLPSSYRRSMLISNGGELETEEDEWEQFPMSFPEGAVAIASNGAGDRLVFLKEGNAFEPVVYMWSHETGALTKVVNDFSELKAL